MPNTSTKKIETLAALMRYWIMEMTTQAQSGHPSSSLSATDLIAALLFGGIFRFDTKNPQYHNNDRLLFSKGHASPLFYAAWAAAGVIPEKELNTYRTLGSRLEGHPTMQFPYTEAPTGSLGQGLSIGVGIALNAQYLDKLDYRTYVLLGDSEMAEGSVWEAIQIASYYNLKNLIGIIDVNRLGQRGQTMYGHQTAAYAKRIRAFGWRVIEIDGHDMSDILRAYRFALNSKNAPTMIIARTLKGKGVPLMENKQGWHGKSLSRAQYETMGDTDALQYTKTRGTIRKPHTKKKFVFAKAKAKAFPQKKEMATREAFGRALVRVGSRDTSVVVVDAEVSNSTKTEFFKELYPDRFFEMFIAEQNMVGVATGLAHMEKKPFVSSFAAFLIRAADQIRMSQYANVNIVFVGSHVGVSIGKDGFSQMALGDIAFFRSIRQSTIVYPADGYSMQALVSAAVAQTGIVYIRSTRAKTPMLYKSSDTFRIGGSKTIHSSQKDTVTVVSAGITLHEALSAYRQLKAEGIRIRVIDAYSIKPIDKRALAKAARETRAIIVVEDHYPDGGLGDVVTNALYGTTTPIHRLAVSRTPRSGRPEKVLHFERIDKRAIIQAVRNYAKK